MEMEVPSFVPSLPDKSRKHPTSHVPEIEDECVNRLWDEIKRAKVEAQSVGKPPFDEGDFDPKTLVLELKSEQVDVGSLYGIENI